MGVNAIRTSHNPPAPELLDIADRLGFLVMDEAFDCWYNGKNQYDYGRFFKQWANRDIEDMVARDLNHPGIIIWSIANEVGETGDTAVIQQLIDAVKTKDVTRPIGQALAAWASADTAGVALEDVVGINYAPDRYDSIHSAHPTWKMFASESSSALRSRGIYDNKNTQCSSYDDNAAGWGATAEASWKNVTTRAWIAGEFIWTGFDYIGEPTPYEWPAKSSYFGAIDTAYLPKDIFYFYQSKWNAGGPPMVHLVPMNWTNFSSGQKVKVMAYTNAENVELFLNGSSLGAKAMATTTGHLEWSVTFAAGTLEAKATNGGNVVATDKLQTAGAPAKLVLKVDRPAIAADGRDLAFVEVDVVDAQGVLVPQAANKIDLAVSGPGTLAGVDNGDATSHEAYQGTSRSAFSGKAMAIVKSTAVPGAVTLTASSGSLTGASATITTAAP
jgi:beta-galactosidase